MSQWTNFITNNLTMKNLILPCTFLFLITACTNPKKSTEGVTAGETSTSLITLTKAPDSPQYPDANLTKEGMDMNAKTDSTFSLDYQFGVEGYELGIQTSDADVRGIVNSGKGQHIHFIVNNGPYSAHYMNHLSSAELSNGNYTVLAFLSRSYHESVKSENAFYIENVNVGAVDDFEVDLSVPHLLYSRPKGTYSGNNARKLMLDFYLINADLSEGGNTVRATINGQEFMINEWASYYIEGLPMGEVTIKLEFLDDQGEFIPSPFNPVERTVTLTE